MVTEVTYENVTYTGRIKISMNCHDEMDYNISVENRKWLYPKIEHMLFAIEHHIRADPSMILQINKVLDKTVDDIRKLIEISKENINESKRIER